MILRCATAALGLLLAVACAGRSARPDALADRFARADARRARELAPDLYARAERARADAQRTPDSERATRSDRELATKLLLAAAIAEAERIENDRAAAAAEARVAEARHARARIERERREIERQLQSEQSARAERAQAARAFGTVPQTAEELSGGRAERQAAQTREGEFLLRRAQLTLAAALALGLTEARGTEVAAAIAAVERGASNADARMLAAAHAALREADRALGEARTLRAASGAKAAASTSTASTAAGASSASANAAAGASSASASTATTTTVNGAEPDIQTAPAASAEETAALIEMASERGLAFVATARGALCDVAPLFAQSGQPTALGRTRLAQLAAVAAAHPHGAILIESAAGVQATGAARKARARAERVERELAAATSSARVQLADGAADAAAGSVQVLFTAYRARP
jgi:hypothetical protein